MRLRSKPKDKIPLDMTPMIDVVFQLMAFFIMTFSVVAPEGDFNIKLPARMGGSGPPTENMPVTVRLEAGADGQLSRLQLGDRALKDFGELRAEILALGSLDAPDEKLAIQVEIDSDYGLEYRHMVDALTAVSGYRNRDGQIIKVLDDIRFAPPRKRAM